MSAGEGAFMARAIGRQFWKSRCRVRSLPGKLMSLNGLGAGHPLKTEKARLSLQFPALAGPFCASVFQSNNRGGTVQPIKIAIAGVGNCASSLIQGIHYYRHKAPDDAIGLMHWEIGGYRPGDIEVVAAFDIDRRKVGEDISKAIFAKPNTTTVFCPDIPESGVKVSMGAVLDGFPEHMKDYPEHRSFVLADAP